MSKEIAVKNENVLEIKPDTSMQDALIQIVQRKDIDPDRLEKFLDLQIKMENRQSQRAFNEAFASFQGECPIIKKNKKVDFASKGGGSVNYNYSPLDEIVHIIKPIMNKYGLSYSFNEVPENGVTNLITTIRHKDGHEVNFDHRFPTIHDDMRMNESQRRKSALSFAKRSALENALGIVTANEDDDARRAIDNEVTKEQLDTINDLIKKTATSEKLFLEFLKVDKLSDLSAHDAKKAINALKAKRSSCIK